MNDDFYKSEWFKSRPEEIQDLLRIYPPMSKFEIKGEIMYLIGFGEMENDEPCALVSKINPAEDYEGALEDYQKICNKHLKDFKKGE